MRLIRRAALLGITIALGSFSTADGFAQRVTRVVDGDTIAVEGVGTVRLIGVDTPEAVHPSQPAQAFGDASKVPESSFLLHYRSWPYTR